MAQIKKLQVQGIRSFGPNHEDRQNIEFNSPLTLILGQNGCGKTTIIECLKYVTTGDVPPGCGTGGSFVHDPKMAREASVKGQVKLLFTTLGPQGDTTNIICRSIEASQKVKTIGIKTLDSTLSRKQPGKDSVTISSKCADINTDLINALGVSKSILNYVIFCHQEDSNWPLDVGSKVKERFDEIFNSVKYKNCLKNVKEVRKKEMDEAKLEKNNAQFYKTDKEMADQKKKEMKKKEAEVKRLETEMETINEKLEPLREQLLEIQEKEKGFSENQKLLAEAKTSLEHCQREKESLEKQISEVFPEETFSNEKLRESSDNVDVETKVKEKELQKLQASKCDIEKDVGKIELKIQKNAAVIGKAVLEQENYHKNIGEKEKISETASEMFGLDDNEDDLLNALLNEELRLKNQRNRTITDMKETECKLDTEIDLIKAKKTSLEEGKKRAQSDMMVHKKEIAQLRRQLNELAGASDTLEKIKKEWKEGEEKLSLERGKVDLPSLKEEIEQEKETVKRLDVKERQLREEAKAMEEQAVIMQKIEHLEGDINDKKEKMKKIFNKRNENFTELFGSIPKPSELKTEFKNLQEKSEEKMKALEIKKKNKESDIRAKTTAKNELKRDLDKKLSRRVDLQSKCAEVIDANEDLEDEIEKTKESLEMERKELQVKEAGKFVYAQQIETLKKKSNPACPTCNRDFKNKGEVSELIQELEELVKGIPVKVKSLESKVKKQTTRLENLNRIRPETHALKQLDLEVKEAEKKVENLDKELKRLHNELDSEDGEYMVTEVSVSELKDVAEDVHTVDGVRRELEQLEDKLGQLHVSVGGKGKLGGRSLEMVRIEEEQLGEKLRSARANLENCQEQVNKHSEVINQLEATQNRLTNRKLEIEGQQQKRAATETKKDELENKVTGCGEEVKKCEAELGPVLDKLALAEKKKSDAIKEREDTVSNIQEKEGELQIVKGNIERLEKNIQAYVDGEKEEELKALKKEKTDLDEKLSERKDNRASIENKISKLKVEVSNQSGRKRLFEDNLRLREYQVKEKTYSRNVRLQESALEELDWKKVEKKKNELNRKWSELNAEKSGKGGQQAEVERAVRELHRELNTSKLKDASQRYKEMSLSYELRGKVADDLNKYYIALDYAIMKYHREKMKVVNKIIRELWLQVYKGNDIDYIEIKTDDDGNVQSGADKKKNYSYRVVMVKNDTEMDMRGRCSAGQKVLSSLIIRLALAETFSTNCGIIALDEPTTNLDRENIESLANALADIATKRAEQRNFQLVVITHDEDFIESLSRCDQLTHFQKVTRNAKGLSEVRRMNINMLDHDD